MHARLLLLAAHTGSASAGPQPGAAVLVVPTLHRCASRCTCARPPARRRSCRRRSASPPPWQSPSSSMRSTRWPRRARASPSPKCSIKCAWSPPWAAARGAAAPGQLGRVRGYGARSSQQEQRLLLAHASGLRLACCGGRLPEPCLWLRLEAGQARKGVHGSAPCRSEAWNAHKEGAPPALVHGGLSLAPLGRSQRKRQASWCVGFLWRPAAVVCSCCRGHGSICGCIVGCSPQLRRCCQACGGALSLAGNERWRRAARVAVAAPTSGHSPVVT